MESWRKQWFEYVKLIRGRESRRTKKPVSHREAMNIASKTWPAQKLKIKKKHERQKRKEARLEKPVLAETHQSTVENM